MAHTFTFEEHRIVRLLSATPSIRPIPMRLHYMYRLTLDALSNRFTALAVADTWQRYINVLELLVELAALTYRT